MQNGTSGVLHDPGFNPNLLASELRNLAVSKVWYLSAVSADFKEDVRVFVPGVCLLIQKKDSFEYFGVFDTGYPSEDGLKSPDLLLRRACWDLRTDYSNCIEADNKFKYLMGDEQLVVENSFTCRESQQALMDLIIKLETYTVSGIGLKKCSRNSEMLGNVSIKVNANGNIPVLCDFFYSQYVSINDFLDLWIENFVQAFNLIDMSESAKPDNSFNVSYIESPQSSIPKWGK